MAAKKLRTLRVPREMRRRLITPEGIDLGVTLGDSGRRAGAFIIDLMIMLATLIVLSVAAHFAQPPGAQPGTGQPDEVIGVIWLIGFFLIRNFYFIALEMRPRAATIGKRALGLRVVARDGGRLTGDAVIARNLMREVEVFLPVTMLISGLFTESFDALTAWLGFGWTAVFLFFPFLNRDRLRVGDLLAGTWVIRATRERLARQIVAVGMGDSFVFTGPQLDAYGVFELETLEGVIRRSDAKARVTVAQAIIDRIAWPSDVGDIDGFLTAYYSQLRQHLEKRLLLGKRRADKHDMAA